MRIIIIILLLSVFLQSCTSQTVQNIAAQETNRGTGNNSVNTREKAPANQERTATKENMINESVLNSVTLKAQAENTGEALIIKYEVENHTDQQLYLWDRMIGYSGSEQIIDPDSAYVFFEEPKTVRIMRAVLPLPKDRDIGRKEIPFARILPPKGTLTGEIKLKRPVTEYSPYYEPLTEENQQLEKCSEIRLIVGWTPPRDGMVITERTVGGEKVFAIRGAWESPYQKWTEEKILLPVDLLTYKTVFERQMPLQVPLQ